MLLGFHTSFALCYVGLLIKYLSPQQGETTPTRYKIIIKTQRAEQKGGGKDTRVSRDTITVVRMGDASARLRTPPADMSSPHYRCEKRKAKSENRTLTFLRIHEELLDAIEIT